MQTVERTDPAANRWFLTPQERGNPATGIDRIPRTDGRAWIAGNDVRLVVHGVAYFRRLYDELCALRAGDRVFFTDWRGDPDELMYDGGPTVGQVLVDLVKKDVEVRALMWRSHSDHLQFNAQQNQHLGNDINEAGGEVLLDQRIRGFGSHHQKLFVIRHKGAPERDVAFVGGIDLCHGRRDDAAHQGDPQQAPMDERYGDRAPWHDAAVEIRGPAVGDLLRTFVERWDDPHPLDRRTPYRMLVQRIANMPRHPSSLPEDFPDPEPAGQHAIQVLRTYGRRRPKYPFAPEGERSVARAYEKAFRLAHSLIYVEDQYLWSSVVAQGIAEALRRSPRLRVIVVVPRYPDQDTGISGPPNRLGQIQAMHVLRATAPGRVGVFDLENAQGVPIYVHAKVCMVDDVWLTCGSDNFNRRSWTNDSELTCALIDPERDSREPLDLSSGGDGARVLARNTRLTLWAEHLGRAEDDPELLDPATAFDLWRETASELDRWHQRGEQGPRPPGQVRWHEPAGVGPLTRLWADPLHRVVFDPDDRPWGLRRRRAF